MAQSNKTGISMVLYVRRYLSYIGMAGVLWLFSGPLWAGKCGKNCDIATFKAEITQGTCDITLIGSSNNIELGTVQFSDVVSGQVNREAKLELGNCTSVVNKNSLVPTITVTGNHDGTSDKTLFRNSNKEGSQVSTAMGITVKLKKFGDKDWSSKVSDGDPFKLANPGTIISDLSPPVVVPVNFSLVCAPAAGQTIADCKKAGKISATMTFTFDYR
ncbi:fimbrial protein [Photorhabdus antumapuensis]|uniref:fimbrial protein n=1 Tax=Photorhabdus antumapuensis TaxID=2862867 RepID=UPI001CECC247|nr:fimbrial protein [Photorhabdus antumapuensis]